MLTIKEGQKLAEEYVAQTIGTDYEVVPKSFEEADELFVFCYNKAIVAHTGNPLLGVVGQGPVVIDRLEGRFHTFGSGLSCVQALRRYRQLKLAWAPVVAAFSFLNSTPGAIR